MSLNSSSSTSITFSTPNSNFFNGTTLKQNGGTTGSSRVNSGLTFAQSLIEQDLAELTNQSDLSDRIVMIVGCGTGNSATAVRLARHGAQLVLVDQTRHEQRLRSLAETCDRNSLHGNRWQYRNNKWQRVQKALPLTIPSSMMSAPSTDVSVTNNQNYQKLIDTVLEQFGRIDSFVFVGSGSIGTDCSLTTTTTEQLTAQLDAAFNRELLLFANLTRLLVPHLERTEGTIVNIATTLALRPPGQGQGLCCAMAQSSIDMFVKCISMELGPKKIRINSINHMVMPNESCNTGQLVSGLEVNQSMMDQYMEKVMISDQQSTGNNSQKLSPLRRPDDVSAAVLYLITARSSFLNGINLVIDGGKILE